MNNKHISYSLVDPSFGDPVVTEENNQYIFSYPCESHHQCTNYELNISRGTYLVELYGASGGHYDNYITLHRNGEKKCSTFSPLSRIKTNIECSQLDSVSGAGGYTSGIITIRSTTRAFLAIGGEGIYGYKRENLYNTPECYLPENMVEGGYNGGGLASNYHVSSSYYGSGSGGGSTDLRFEENDVFHRVIVAGAGGGTDDVIGGYDDGSGGSGGGLTAQGFWVDGQLYTTYVATQISGFTFGSGESAQENGSKNKLFGSDGFGTPMASDRAGSGSGWFGGFASHNQGGGGGGGSSFVLTADAEIPKGNITHHDTFYENPVTREYAFSDQTKYLFKEPIMIPGVWSGNGFAIITYLHEIKRCSYQRRTRCNGAIFTLVILSPTC